MSDARKATFDAMIPTYERVRLKLSEEEKPLFDKAMALLEEVVKVDNPRALCLDAALAVGLSAITLHPIVMWQIVPALQKLLNELCVLNQEVSDHASSYRH